jgi:hypothetical protein
MWFGYVFIAFGLWQFVFVEKCRRSPEWCKSRFMGDSGATRSFIALQFIGDPTRAQAEFLRRPGLRRAYLIERYVWAILTSVAGIGILLYS